MQKRMLKSFSDVVKGRCLLKIICTDVLMWTSVHLEHQTSFLVFPQWCPDFIISVKAIHLNLPLSLQPGLDLSVPQPRGKVLHTRRTSVQRHFNIKAGISFWGMVTFMCHWTLQMQFEFLWCHRIFWVQQFQSELCCYNCCMSNQKEKKRWFGKVK